VFRSEKQAKIAIKRLENRIGDLQEKVHNLESGQKRLELEWIETYDKVRHQLSRMARRGSLSNGKGPVDIVPEEVSEEVGMDAISAKIHARRNHGFLGRK